MMKLPSQWAFELGYKILDWDGWRDKSIAIGVTKQEFLARVQKCTIKSERKPNEVG